MSTPSDADPAVADSTTEDQILLSPNAQVFYDLACDLFGEPHIGRSTLLNIEFFEWRSGLRGPHPVLWGDEIVSFPTIGSDEINKYPFGSFREDSFRFLNSSWMKRERDFSTAIEALRKVAKLAQASQEKEARKDSSNNEDK